MTRERLTRDRLENKIAVKKKNASWCPVKYAIGCFLTLVQGKQFQQSSREKVELSQFWKGKEKCLSDTSTMSYFIKKLPLKIKKLN